MPGKSGSFLILTLTRLIRFAAFVKLFSEISFCISSFRAGAQAE
jgi:hypothetical protein